MADDGFTLTSHEVMRGVKLRDGNLVLRPGGGVLALSAVGAVLFMTVSVLLLLAGDLVEVLLAAYASLLAANLAVGLRVRVVATPSELVVRNRFRTLAVPLTAVREFDFEQRHWLSFGPPAPGRLWTWSPVEVAVIVTDSERVRLEALVSAPEPDSPARMKADTLHRWLTRVH